MTGKLLVPNPPGVDPFFAYDANYLIDNKAGIILDAEGNRINSRPAAPSRSRCVMFNRQTLFIVGAGASAEVDFPVGIELARTIGGRIQLVGATPSNLTR
jgi:hypothetical protein